MVECKDCRTLNGLDAKFCKGCGKQISAVDLSEAVARHEKLTSDGYSAYNAGRIDEALLVAQAAADANPSSPRAYTLLGMCYERTGQIAEALEAYERVLAINPDSPLEKLKVNQLRNGLANQLMVRPAQSKRMALIAAGLIVLIMICVATALGISNGRNNVAQQQQTNSNKSALVAQNDPDIKSFNVSGQLPQSNPAAQTQVQHPAPSTVNPTSVNNLNDQSNRVTPPLIKPGGGDGGGLSPFPVNTQVVPDSAGGTKAAEQPQTGDPQPGAVDPGAAAQGAAQQTQSPQTQNNMTAAPPQEDNGIIDIQVARQSQSSQSTEDSPNRVEALVRSAKDEMIMGHYDKAAKSYEKALAAGGDPATINQRLGMCYDKLGRSSDAASAYTRAVAAFQAAIDSGHGDPSRLKSGLQSCQQALKVLKG